MKWTEEYSTGIERLDDQHRMLFAMSDDFRLALSDGKGAGVYAGLLDSLDLYARTHFKFEEGCMTERHCPFAQQNKLAHDKFVITLGGFHARFREHGYQPDEATHLVDTLDRWLSGHIMAIDRRLKDYVTS